jgi:hypothetical protein
MLGTVFSIGSALRLNIEHKLENLVENVGELQDSRQPARTEVIEQES